MPHWGWLGTHDGNSPWYLFYSGVFGVLTIAAGLAWNGWVNYRHRQCHEPWCWRISQVTVDDKGTRSCWHHHPEGRPRRGHIRERYHLYLGQKPGRG